MAALNMVACISSSTRRPEQGGTQTAGSRWNQRGQQASVLLRLGQGQSQVRARATVSSRQNPQTQLLALGAPVLPVGHGVQRPEHRRSASPLCTPPSFSPPTLLSTLLTFLCPPDPELHSGPRCPSLAAQPSPPAVPQQWAQTVQEKVGWRPPPPFLPVRLP